MVVSGRKKHGGQAGEDKLFIQSKFQVNKDLGKGKVKGQFQVVPSPNDDTVIR